jgi:hypothetical protein
MTSTDRTPVAQELLRQRSIYESGKHITTQEGMKCADITEKTELESYMLGFINAFFYSNSKLY